MIWVSTMMNMKTNIFQQVKECIKHNPNSLAVLFPMSKQKGDEVYFDTPSYNSWSYNVKKGVVKDFRTGESLDIIDTYQIIYNLQKSIDAAKEMARKLNLENYHENKTNKTSHPTNEVCKNHEVIYSTYTKEKEISSDNLDTKKSNVTDIINKIWGESIPIKNTIACKYLLQRNVNKSTIELISNDTLRYHPALYNKETGQNHPALIAGIYDDNNKLIAIHRHYLNSKGEKLKTKNNKMMLSSVNGYGVYFFNKSDTIAICEGVESGLSILQNTGYDVCCALSATNLINLKLSFYENNYKNIIIYSDYEKSQTGIKAALRVAKDKEIKIFLKKF